MNREQALNYLKSTGMSREQIADVVEALSESCEDCISLPKGALKMRGNGYVVYNYDWIKENWQIELKILGIDWKKQMQEPILDKIRAEIADLADADAYGDYQQGFNFGLMKAAQIIDKYKASPTGKDGSGMK